VIVSDELETDRVRILDRLIDAARASRALSITNCNEQGTLDSTVLSLWKIDLRAPPKLYGWDHRRGEPRSMLLAEIKTIVDAPNTKFVERPRDAGSAEVEFEVAEERLLEALSSPVRVERTSTVLRCIAPVDQAERVARFVLQHAPLARSSHPRVVAEMERLMVLAQAGDRSA
jgi:predicted DNA-binding transcriptional regulator YafY